MQITNRVIKILDGISRAVNSLKDSISGYPKGIYANTLTSPTAKASLEPNPRFPREPLLGPRLYDLVTHCGDAITALAAAERDVFAAPDGSDQCFWLHDKVKQKSNIPIPKDILALSEDLFNRRDVNKNYVIGGRRLASMLFNVLAYGDAFCEIGLVYNEESKAYEVSRLVDLPTYEMFTITDDSGVVQLFQQKRYLEDTETVDFSTSFIIHISHLKRVLYGRSLFSEQALTAWENLKVLVSADLPARSRSLSFNPDVFVMPPNFNQQRAAEFEEVWRQKKRAQLDDVVIIPNDASYRRGNEVSTDFEGHLLYYKNLREQIIPGGFPSWYFQGIGEDSSSRDLSGQPSVMYSRMRNYWCVIISDVIRQVLDTEIYFKLGENRLKELYKLGGYTIMFPNFIINPNIANSDQKKEDSEGKPAGKSADKDGEEEGDDV